MLKALLTCNDFISKLESDFEGKSAFLDNCKFFCFVFLIVKK